jgi:hypothetical protein
MGVESLSAINGMRMSHGAFQKICFHGQAMMYDRFNF